MNEVKTFVGIVIARLKGDNAKETALKNQRIAIAATKGQIAALESTKVNREMALEQANEALELVAYPSEIITSPDNYIDNLLEAKNNVVRAEEELQSVEDSLEYFNAHLEQIKK